MKQSSIIKHQLLWLLVFCLCSGAAMQVQAQRSTFGGGRTGGFGGGRSSGAYGGSSTRDYNNNSMIGSATFSSDPESRRLIVITDEETSGFISQVITNLDRPKPQVLIKVVFLEVTYKNTSDIGLEGTFNKGNNPKGLGGNIFGLSTLGTATNLQFNSVGQPVQSFITTPPGAGLYQVLGSDYQVTLQAIAQAGKAKVLSRPSILARNNQPATILVGQTFPLITSVRYDTFGNAINGITYQDVGIILRVTPFITEDGMVEMIVSPEISSISQTDKVQIQPGAFAPAIDKRSADTVVVTPDKQTVIIGGLIQDSKAESESKIPLLGDIPGLGFLFKRKTKADAKTELLIFLTPQIVLAPSELAALSSTEQSKSKSTKAFTEKELNQFLDTLPTKEPGKTEPEPKKNK